MRKKWIKRICVGMVAFALVNLTLSDVSHVTMATSQDDVNDAQQAEKEQQQVVDRLRNELNQIGANINNTKEYVSQLDSKLNDYTSQLTSINQKVEAKQTEIANKQAEIDAKKLSIADKQAEIVTTTINLEAAQAEQDAQYEAMKKRIQYMYECGDTDFLELIFTSEDLSEMLGRTEYISSIMEYDRQQLEKMIANKNDISDLLVKLEAQNTALEEEEKELEEQKASLEAEESELLSLQKEMNNQVVYVNTILDEKNKTLSNLQGQQNSTSAQLELEKEKLEEQKAFAKKMKEMYEREKAAAAASGISASQAAKDTLKYIYDHGGFTWPMPGYTYITANYGYWTNPVTHVYSLHSGTDISGSGINGKPIVAAYSGTVILSQYYYGYGNTVQISHGTGVVTQYSHCSSLAVKEGDYVQAGQVIAYVGSTGAATGPHLHLGVYIEGECLNPMDYIFKP